MRVDWRTACRLAGIRSFHRRAGGRRLSGGVENAYTHSWNSGKRAGALGITMPSGASTEGSGSSGSASRLLF